MKARKTKGTWILAWVIVASVAPLAAFAALPSNDEIHALLAERMQSNGVGAVVGVIEPSGRRVVAYGKSGAANARPLDGDTVFQLGSLTKTFTTLLLADMVRRGEVKLDDPAQKFLPAGVKMPERGRPITLLDLATHRSGLPSMPTNVPIDGQPNPIEAYTVPQLFQFLATYTPDRAPGEKWQYSNLGVAVLGRLLALRAAQDYEALLTARVLRPLGMTSTSITLSADQLARLAPGHDRYLQPVYTWEMKAMPASGSLRSTANDLLIYLSALLGYTKTPLHDAMELQLATRFPAGGTQAPGWGVRDEGNEQVFAHEGGKAGYRCAVAFNTTTRTGVVVLQNANTEDRPTAIAMHILSGRALDPAPRAPAPRTVLKLKAETLDRYAGRYQFRSNKVLTVRRSGDHLLLDSSGAGGAEFLASGERDFFLNIGNDDLTFDVDASGRVTGLRLYGDGKDAGTYESAVRL